MNLFLELSSSHENHENLDMKNHENHETLQLESDCAAMEHRCDAIESS